jgi:hypothetical protein
MSIQEIAKKGRYGDNHLLHVSDAEVQGLNALANEMYGHGLTQNPDTGLPEAFLLAPLLAPMLASSVPALAGMGAVGTGIAAAGLGTAEAAARGMDDPLMQGAMAGLTAGAGSAIGSNLGQMGQDAATQAAAQGAQASTQAIANPMADLSMQNAAVGAPDLTQSLASPTIQPSNLGATADLGMGPQFGQFNTVDMAGGAGAPFNTMPVGPQTPPPLQTGAAPTPSTMSDVAAGAKQAFGSQEGFDQFMADNKMALSTGITGLGGTAALDAQQSAREAMDEQKAKKKAKYDEMVARIKKNYADAGRELPKNPYGRDLFSGPQGFKEGRSVYSEAVPKPNFDEELDKLSLDELRRLKGMITQYKADLDGPPSGNEWVSNDATLDALTRAEKLTGRSMADDAVKFKEGKEVKPVTMPEPGSYLPDWVKKYAQDQQKKTDKRAAGGYLEGGIASLKGDGMSDSVPAKIDGSQPAALSTGEYVIPADVVSHLGNGSSDDGAMRLDEMLDRVRMARTDTKKQAPQIKPDKYLPA